MKPVVVFLAITAALALNGCVTMKPNPEFRSCANSCTKKQDECMVRATTAPEVSQCNATMNSCITRCEEKYPRYLQP